MKKLAALFAILVLALGAVYIFGMAETSSPAPAPQATPGAASAAGSVYYLNFKPEQAEQWAALGKTYTDQTGVPVSVVTAASNTYETTLASELEKAEAPTLFQVNGPVGLARWRSYCADLKDTELYRNLKSDEFALKDGSEVLGIAYVIETYGILYNRALLAKYCALENAVIKDASEINRFATLKAVADDIQARKDEVGVTGAFASAGLDSSSNWRFQTHLANLPIYYEYKADGVTGSEAIKGTYLENYKAIWDLYMTDSTTEPALLGARTGDDSLADFTLGEAVFYQNGTWVYGDVISAGMTDADLGMLPIYIGVEGEENQGLCTGSENYWCINKFASPQNAKATEDFLAWVVTSSEGRDMLANQMGFETPFRAFDEGYASGNALIAIANQFIAEGKTPVTWSFATIPSQTWKDKLAAALLEYAQGAKGWEAVQAAFVDNWASEYALLNGATAGDQR